MTRGSVRWRSVVWLAGSVLGGVVVALPDSGDRVFSLSETHGPAPLDLLGVVVLFGSWVPVAIALPALWRATDRVTARGVAALAAVGAVGLVATIGADLGWWWLAAVSALVVAQAVLLASGWRSGLPH